VKIIKLYLFQLFLFFAINANAEGNLTVKIQLEEDGKLVSDAKITAIADKDTVILDGTNSKKYDLVLKFGNFYKVEVSKKGYLSKKFTVDARFPTTLRQKSFSVDINLRIFKIYPEINYDEYMVNAIKINFIGNSSGGYFSYVISSLQYQEKLDNSLDAKIRQLKGGRLVETETKIKELSPQILELFENQYKSKTEKESLSLLAEAYKAANEIRIRARENAEKEHDIIINAAKERSKNSSESDLSYINSQTSNDLIKNNKNVLKNNKLPDEKKMQDKQRKYDALANKSDKTLKDSIELHIADISLQRDKVGKAKYVLELMKLRAKTHEDSMLIQEREAEILLAEKEISDTEKALLYANNKIKLQEFEIKSQRIIVLSISLLLVFALVFLFFLYRNYKQKQKMNKILAQKNVEITDSIEYAQKIQNVILPEVAEMKAVFSDAFVFLNPKDIVSGDFYWFKKIENKLFFSVIDCTGHGVPGAIVSIIGFDGLERALNEFKLIKPSSILDKLNEIVTSILSKSQKTNVKDGMDIAFCSFSYDTYNLEFAGAHNPIYIITDKEQLIDNQELIKPTYTQNSSFMYEIKADRQAIGKSAKPFANHAIKLSKNDKIYLFSDGFPDQFGGENLEKFKYKNFKKLLSDIHKNKMHEQYDLIYNALQSWKGNYEQIDDICIMGVEL